MFQITKLLKNADNAASSSPRIGKQSIKSTKFLDHANITNDVSNSPTNSKKLTKSSRLQKSVDEVMTRRYMQRGKGGFTEELLAKGLITQDMLNKLQREWDQKGKDSTFTIDEDKVKKKGKTVSRKGKGSR